MKERMKYEKPFVFDQNIFRHAIVDMPSLAFGAGVLAAKAALASVAAGGAAATAYAVKKAAGVRYIQNREFLTAVLK